MANLMMNLISMYQKKHIIKRTYKATKESRRQRLGTSK